MPAARWHLGIVNRVVPPDRPTLETAALADRLAVGPVEAYARTKALLKASLGDAFDAQLPREAENFAACAARNDFVEGVRAVLEKRRPLLPLRDRAAGSFEVNMCYVLREA
jgi:2-(1,2-epoxy-1,2-dihydrophenyl)acetyl-CoA isomerase